MLGLILDTHRGKTGDVLIEAGRNHRGLRPRRDLVRAHDRGLTSIGLRLIGVPSLLVLAVLAGIGELIPVVGPFLAAIPALAVALATGEANVLVVLAFFIGLQQVKSNILIPLIMRGQASIPPLLSLVAFLIGVAVAGILGR